jgi:hypothetical protein
LVAPPGYVADGHHDDDICGYVIDDETAGIFAYSSRMFSMSQASQEGYFQLDNSPPSKITRLTLNATLLQSRIMATAI